MYYNLSIFNQMLHACVREQKDKLWSTFLYGYLKHQVYYYLNIINFLFMISLIPQCLRETKSLDLTKVKYVFAALSLEQGNQPSKIKKDGKQLFYILLQLRSIVILNR